MQKPTIEESPNKDINESSGLKKKPHIKEETPQCSKDTIQEPPSSLRSPLEAAKGEKDILKENCALCHKEPGSKRKYWNHTLQHNGPNFLPPYQNLPEDIKFLYDGKEMRLSSNAEEVARFYAELLDHNCTTEPTFQKNFFQGWRSVMTEEERLKITDLKKCNFNGIQKYSKNETSRIVAQLKKEKEDKYGFCIIDGDQHRIYNCNVEFPGLFKGDKGNPKNGMIKKRIEPEDVTINCSKDHIPQPPPNTKWKGCISDPTASWLAAWKESVQQKEKYMKLHYNSPVKGNVDQNKYKIARHLHIHINTIRKSYKNDWKSKDPKIQQRGLALYIIDKLSLRIGNEKYENTVGCCSLCIKHVTLHKDICAVTFDFKEKGFKPYKNELIIEQEPFKLLENFTSGDDKNKYLFEYLLAKDLNNHVATFMTDLTAKVFRTYNASLMFQQRLDELTKADGTTEEKIVSYKEAAFAAATLCNHRRSVPQSIDALTKQLEGLTVSTNTDTTMLDYLDPRITVAWCKNNNIPVEKVFTKKKIRDKFKWAIEKTESSYRFEDMGETIRKKLLFR